MKLCRKDLTPEHFIESVEIVDYIDRNFIRYANSSVEIRFHNIVPDYMKKIIIEECRLNDLMYEKLHKDLCFKILHRIKDKIYYDIQRGQFDIDTDGMLCYGTPYYV